MRALGRHWRTIWPSPDGRAVEVIDQRQLPHRFETAALRSPADAADAIRRMVVRGAPLIGVTAMYGLALQADLDAAEGPLSAAAALLRATRPTAVNLAWAVDQTLARLLAVSAAERRALAWRLAAEGADADVRTNEAIGRHGLDWLSRLRRTPERPLQILTHCNAGWLATVDGGTALAPIYRAAAEGWPLHVWVDETRPRNQGASLTSWELREQGIAHTVIADNAGGHLMQTGQVDVVLVGCDRVTARGDVCNKIGTYLKALAAHDNGVPFVVAMPTSTLDLRLQDGLREIPIENRDAREVTHIAGTDADGRWREVCLVPEGTAAANPAFDVTPARWVSALITEHGVIPATEAGLRSLPLAP